jgi:hypothetical protein
MHLVTTASILVALLSVVSVFTEIPFVSEFAFWVLLAAWIMAIARG